MEVCIKKTMQMNEKGKIEMGMKHFKPYTPSRRNMTVSDYAEITKKTPEKSLLEKKKKNHLILKLLKKVYQYLVEDMK